VVSVLVPRLRVRVKVVFDVLQASHWLHAYRQLPRLYARIWFSTSCFNSSLTGCEHQWS